MNGFNGRRTRVAALFATTLLCAACTADAPPEQVAPVSEAPDTALLGAESVAIAGFTLDTVRRAPWTSTVSAPARIVLDPARHQTLGSITEGRVSRVLVRVGDRVRTGDVLVTIHSHEIMDARSGLVRAESQHRAAVAEREAAARNLSRAERLLAAKAVGASEVERAAVVRTAAEARESETAAELQRAKGLMEHLLGEGPVPDALDPHDVLIRAPMPGIVVSRDVIAGTVVLPGDALLAVADPEALQLELRLNAAQSALVRSGDSLTFTLVGDADAARGRAVVSRVSPVLDASTRTTYVLARLLDVPSGTQAERFATAHVTSGRDADALLVPMQSVQSLGGDTIVIVAEQRGEGLHLRAAPVRIGRRDAMKAEVLAGIAAGDVVIARGATIARAELMKRREGGGE
jgi:cobalt-zinc-cadmium efflux system membrane fusion protein